MFGNVSWGCGAAPPGTSSSRATCIPQAAGLPANGRSVCPTARAPRGRTSCPRGLRAVRAPARGADQPRAPRQGQGAGGVAPRGANFLKGVPAPGWEGSATETRGPRAGHGSRDSEHASPRGPSLGGTARSRGARACHPRARGRAPARPAPPRRSCARGPDSCDGGHSGFANRAQPLGGKVPAVAAGGGHILTFSTRWPERERDGDTQEPPQRGQGPSSGARLHSFDLGRNSPFSKIKGAGGRAVGWGGKAKVSKSVFAPPPNARAKQTILPRRRGRGGRPLSVGSRGPGLGRVGNPGRAGAGCRRRRPPFSNPEKQEGGWGGTATRGGQSPNPSGPSATHPPAAPGGGGAGPEPRRREGATQFASLPRSPGCGRGRPGRDAESQ